MQTIYLNYIANNYYLFQNKVCPLKQNKFIVYARDPQITNREPLVAVTADSSCIRRLTTNKANFRYAYLINTLLDKWN